ncbi:protein RTE1-HOMOLOG isoform X2 [Vigna radiata var. radiata]|uniref:Protein RTE1-HOMOLOG isoform X2 n=1 Tax=Vigna radiata var. radiata TaxID=3916 RepID=A0A3Q0EJT2_VIGRR|nr:protein RTE1-HOMOLOG isoform X2 [Vigna radiata var. radiata]
MGEELDTEQQEDMMERSYSQTMQIDPKRARFPCSIVWSPLPVISWFIPCIGHVGICREDGVILDFAGPNFVCVDHFAFGAATRYFQIPKEKCCIPLGQSAYNGEEDYTQGENRVDLRTWDDALRKTTQEFQHRSYNLFTCNCHSFVVNNLNSILPHILLMPRHSVLRLCNRLRLVYMDFDWRWSFTNCVLRLEIRRVLPSYSLSFELDLDIFLVIKLF